MKQLKSPSEPKTPMYVIVKGYAGPYREQVLLILLVHEYRQEEFLMKRDGALYNPLDFGSLLYCGNSEMIPPAAKACLNESYMQN